ncbi:MAG: hypothetical protein WD270_03730 [Acetobacterales bacterium]
MPTNLFHLAVSIADYRSDGTQASADDVALDLFKLVLDRDQAHPNRYILFGFLFAVAMVIVEDTFEDELEDYIEAVEDLEIPAAVEKAGE